MKMFIANCTKQVQSFTYRLPETTSPRTQKIEIGGQVQVSGDLSQTEIDAIIEQQGPYGLVALGDVDRSKPFIGTCYSIGSPVPVEKIKRALVHNDDVLTERGKAMRTEAAVATHASLEGQLDPNQLGGLSSLETTVTEDVKDGGAPKVNEGVRVTRSGGSRPPAKVRARASR